MSQSKHTEDTPIQPCVSKPKLGDAMNIWLQTLDTMKTDECQLKLVSIMVAMKKVVSQEEMKAITKAMIRSAGAKHGLIELFDDDFYEGDLFKIEGGEAALPLQEMRRYIRAMELAKGRKYKIVLAEPECSYIKVEMPVYVPDAETAWLMRSQRPCRDFEQMRAPLAQYAPAEVEMGWVSNDLEEEWEAVGKKGKHK